MEFEGKSVLITGAGSGFGRAAATHFAGLGGQVLCVDRNENRIRSVLESLPPVARGAHSAIVRDLRPADAADAVVSEALEKVSRVDVLVSSAGVCHFNAINKISAEEWDEVMEVDTRSLFYMGVRVAEAMKADGKGGAIVNIGSNAGRKGRALSAHYAAAKAAVTSITESLALAYGPFGITVNTVSPAVVLTPMWGGNFEELCALTGKSADELVEMWTKSTPLRRLGTVEDVVELIGFLSSRKAAFITGQHINVCGGFMHTC